jgi:hypothetical protein
MASNHYPNIPWERGFPNSRKTMPYNILVVAYAMSTLGTLPRMTIQAIMVIEKYAAPATQQLEGS